MHMSSELVSVIIPFYSNTRWLCEALDSVLSQTYENFEVIVVVDGSAEDLSDIYYEYSSRVNFINQVNLGAAAARNTGIDFARGSYVAFLDSDDLWAPNKLELQIDYMKSNGFLWCHSYYFRFNKPVFNLPDNSLELIKFDFEGVVFPKTFIWNPIATPSIIISSSLLKEYAFKFNTCLEAGEDTDLWNQLASCFPLGCVKCPLVYVRVHGKNSAFNCLKQLTYKAFLFRRIVDFRVFFKSSIHFYSYKFIFFLAFVGFRFLKLSRLTLFKFPACFIYAPIWLASKIMRYYEVFFRK